MIRIVFSLLLILLAALARGQEFNYVHYDTKDGLAGSTVYDMCQDKDGFMWFGTENGLSRFDGAHFKNFTVQDGLPDNEVLKLFADSKGRIWISTFNKELCFFYKGKIYTKRNDKILKQVEVHNFISSFVEDANGTIGLSDDTRTITIIEPGNPDRVTRHLFPQWASVSYIYDCRDQVKITAGDASFKNYLYSDGKFQFLSSNDIMYSHENSKQQYCRSYTSCDGKKVKYILLKPNYIHLSSGNKRYLSFCSTYDGSWSIDTVKNDWDIHYLPGKKVTNAMTDDEKNIWFSTIGEGVYKLPSREIKTITFPDKNGVNNNEVFSLFKYNNGVIAGLNHAIAAFVSDNKVSVKNYAGARVHLSMPQTNRLYSAKKLSDNSILFGFDLFLVRDDGKKRTYNYIYPVKSVEEISKDSILAGTSGYVFLLRPKDLQIIDTIWRERSTKLFYHAGKYYIGMLGGLYEVNKDKTHTFLGSLHPSLTRRITDIKAAADGTLWIATADQGIIGYKNNHITGILKDSNGLSSNICKTLFLQGKYLWAGTSRGINKIDISDTSYPIIKYSTSDGLPSDIINAVYVEDTMVYVGSPAGLTVFNENKISSYSICKLNMLNIVVSGQEFDSLHPELSYKRNNIRFIYTAVSLKSAGDITYYYRLTGLDTSWAQTTQSSLDYPSLPPGDYKFQLYAVNKFGVKSEMVTVSFSVSTPFWKSLWFYAVLLLFTAAAVGWIVNDRNKRYNKKLKDANKLQKQFAALEQQALQAQMNPHFIFNCLNGIQQYILTGNKEKANEYLTGFARLIRQTLDNSGKKTISVAQEIKYLAEYLEMEKMRAAGSFSYKISASENTDTVNAEIPAMLLQPYVENSLRHGLRYKTNGNGLVEIIFEQKNETLFCTVRDNGVGRKRAAELKSNQHIEYQSKGMSLTARRIDLLNRINDDKMRIVINDLFDGDELPCGTEVIIQIPLN